MTAATLLRVLDLLAEVGPSAVGLVRRLAGRSTAAGEREPREAYPRAEAAGRAEWWRAGDGYLSLTCPVHHILRRENRVVGGVLLPPTCTPGCEESDRPVRFDRMARAGTGAGSSGGRRGEGAAGVIYGMIDQVLATLYRMCSTTIYRNVPPEMRPTTEATAARDTAAKSDDGDVSEARRRARRS